MLSLVLFLLLPIGGSAMLWLAYQVRVKRRYQWIRDHQRRPVARAELIADAFARMVAAGGVALWILAVFMLFGWLPVAAAGPSAGLVASVIAVWRHLLLRQYERLARTPAPPASAHL